MAMVRKTPMKKKQLKGSFRARCPGGHLTIPKILTS